MAVPTLKQLITTLSTWLFKGGILSKIIETAATIVIAELVTSMFKGIKQLPASEALASLHVDSNVFLDELQGIEKLGGITPEQINDLNDLYNEARDIAPIFHSLYPIVYTTQRLKQITDLITGQIYQIYAKKYRPIPAPPNSVLQESTSGGPDSDLVRDVLARNGIPDADIELMIKASQRKLPEQVIIANLHQRVISDETAHLQLEAMGYSKKDAEYILSSDVQVPDVITLISLAQSNAFDNADAATFGTDSERPKSWDSFIATNGLSSDFATYTWRSRYNMPPLQLFYNAVRLGLLNQEERNLYYKAIGIPPNVRGIMDAAITTPVNTGYAFQAFSSHIIDEGTFKEILVKNGAGKVEQDIVVKLAKAQANPAISSNTVTQIRYALSDGFINDQQALSMLDGVGLTPDQAQMEVTLAHYNTQYTQNKTALSRIKDAFIKGEITGDATQSDIIHLGITSDAAQQYINTWRIEAQVTEKIPTITEYQDMWKYGIIKDINDLINGIIRNGYNHADATNIAALMLARTGVTNG